MVMKAAKDSSWRDLFDLLNRRKKGVLLFNDRCVLILL